MGKLLPVTYIMYIAYFGKYIFKILKPSILLTLLYILIKYYVSSMILPLCFKHIIGYRIL